MRGESSGFSACIAQQNAQLAQFALLWAELPSAGLAKAVLISKTSVLPSDSISVFSRPSKGVRVMKVGDDQRVITMTCLERDENAESDTDSENYTDESNETVSQDNESQD